MKQVYFLILLSFCFLLKSTGQSVLNPTDTIATYNSSKPPTQPTWGQIGKWVRTKRLSWNTDEYKSYIYKGCAFRLHFPKSYNPTANDGKKYPMLVFFHGLGETGTIYDNEYQLYHGGDVFQAAINNGTFDGYILCMQSQGYWGGSQYTYIAEIIDYMVANNKLDQYRVSDNGLSAGGQATWQMLLGYPSYIAAALPMSNVEIGYKDASTVNQVKFTPLWLFQGGLDGSPAPSTAQQVRDAMLAGGANFKYTEYPTLGHGTWDSTWKQPDFWPYLLRAYSSNPWPLTGRTKFCPGDNINVTIGLAPGFTAYQWRLNGSVISGATSNTIKATQAGTYDARVQRNGIWSDWSKTPVTIIVQSASATPPIQISGSMSQVIPAADGKNYVTLQVSGNDSYTSYAWKKVGSDSVLGTQSTYAATQPGRYIVAATPQYACSSLYSTPFTVIDAKGPNAPTAAKSLLASTLSNTQIQLGWSQAAQQVNAPTAFEIYRGTSSGSYAYITQVSSSSTSYIDSNLSAKAKYYYVVRAVDSTGAAALSNEAVATTFSDATPPSAPVNLRTTYTTPTTIQIAWDASTDNVAVDHYAVYVNGALSNITNQTSFILTGLVQYQPYAITVKAVDAGNNYSAVSNQITAEPMLGGLQYKFYTTTTAWSKLPDFSSLTPVKTGVSSNTDLTVATQSTNYGILWQGYIQIPVNGSYTFRTTSDDGSALWFNSLTPTGTPTVNNDGSHSSTSKNSSALTLTAGIYPICIAYFQVSGSASMSVSWACSALFGNTTQRAIENKYFTGTYVNAGAVPAVPTNVAATAAAYNKINVSWKDNSSNETGFEVYRSLTSTGAFSIAGTTAANATTFTDSSLSPSTTYYYKIQAINKYGNSGLSVQDTTLSGGLTYKYYVGTWTSTPDFSSLTPSKTGTASTFALTGASGNGYGFLFQGNINIPTTGSYTFYTKSANGSKLYIGGYASSNLLVTNNSTSSANEVSAKTTLTAGVYPIYVAYYYNKSKNNNGASFTVSYAGPNISKTTIPASALIQKNASPWPSATTLALPAAPSAPANFVATAASASQIALTWGSVSGTTSYQLLRSVGDSLHYMPLTTIVSTAVSYSDTGLASNLIHYYKLKANGAGGNVSNAVIAAATTKDNAPVVTKLNAAAVAFGTTTSVVVSATDADGDALSFATKNLPAFVTVNNSGNNTVTLVMSPAQSDMNVYNNITVIASDIYGGKDSTVFNLTINDNYAPTIDSIADYSLNENDSINIPLSAHDRNSGDVLSWSASNLPNAYTITNTSNGNATLTLHPNYLAAGTYNGSVTVSDGNGGTATRNFNITVKNVDPSTNIYARFQYVDTIGKPWNSITTFTTNNLKDASGATTNVGLAVQGPWFVTFNTGPTTGNNSGVYPDAVLQDYLYFGIFGGPETVDTKITGLDTSKLYDLTFFAASIFPVDDNGSTIYTIGNQSVALHVQANTKNTVSINGVKPAADGTITFTMSKAANAPVGYINALIIHSSYDDGTVPAAPTTLAAQNVEGKGVQLSWNDVAYNESGYYVYRALASNQVYTSIGQTKAEAATFTDTTISGNTQYLYKVAAFNSHGVSAYSNIASITTINNIPKLVAISDVALKNNQTTTVNIIAKDDSTDHITFTTTGLPSFATFTDNGNGTGTIKITPTANNLGGYPVTIIATDNANASTSVSFNILVSDPNVSSTYISFSDGAHSLPKPWNMLAGWPSPGATFNNINDDSNAPTGITIKFKNGFQGIVPTGMQPVDGVGIYPNVVMRTGEYEGSTNKDTIVVSGLSSSKKYNFVFFGSHDDGLKSITNYTIGSTTVTLNATANLNKTVQINGISPDASGNVYIAVQKASGSDYAFISTLIIQSYASSYTALAPSGLRATATARSSISLQWQDNAYSETGYQIWRAADSVSSYTLLATVGAGITSYKDSNLVANKTYNYAVRTVFGSAYSSFSNTIAASTYAYNVFVNYTLSNNAPLPWNNIDALPQADYTISNFYDEKGVLTSTGMYFNTDWAGLYSAGMNPLNNSGAVPDTVMIDSYGLFPGQTATFKVTGLNIGMKYDFTFFASSQAYGDVNVAYTINGVTTLLNTSLNINGMQTIYGVTPDNNGNVTISVAPGTPTSQLGLIGALIIGAYTPSVSNTIPALPATQSVQSTGSTQSAVANAEAAKQPNTFGEIKAYPNPFHNNFTVIVPSEINSSVQVMLYDISGKLVYRNAFENIQKGTNTLTVTTGSNLTAGVYTLLIINNGDKSTKTIKLIKQ